jgi:hypothetical protein
VTAPLTPNDQQPPVPHGSDEESGRRAVGRQVREGLIVAVLVAVCGVLLGLLWLWLSPRVPLISDGSAIYLKDSEGEQAVGADGWFTLLGLAFGAVAAGAAFLWRREGGVAVVVGLAAGGVLASLLAWRMGVWLGPPQNVIAHAKQIGANKVFSAPLQLRAKGALLAWPAASMAVFLGLTSLFVPHEPQPEPQWEGWQDPRTTPHDPYAAEGAHPAEGEATDAGDPASGEDRPEAARPEPREDDTPAGRDEARDPHGAGRPGENGKH